MSVIIKFLEVLGPLLRKGKLSYGDALKGLGHNMVEMQKV